MFQERNRGEQEKKRDQQRDRTRETGVQLVACERDVGVPAAAVTSVEEREQSVEAEQNSTRD